GMALYGHELDRQTTPFEAGLRRFVALGKGDFVGRQGLLESKDHPRKRLAGFRMDDRSVPRGGYEVRLEPASATGSVERGVVTSGGYSPTLDATIGLAYLPPDQVAAGGPMHVIIRGQPRPAHLVDMPFYRRKRGTP
ncbi:MAG: glycine cleavage T C-terminal barrel domain-containing protein, partial [Chloroflexota bacterium]